MGRQSSALIARVHEDTTMGRLAGAPRGALDSVHRSEWLGWLGPLRLPSDLNSGPLQVSAHGSRSLRNLRQWTMDHGRGIVVLVVSSVVAVCALGSPSARVRRCLGGPGTERHCDLVLGLRNATLAAAAPDPLRHAAFHRRLPGLMALRHRRRPINPAKPSHVAGERMPTSEATYDGRG